MVHARIGSLLIAMVACCCLTLQTVRALPTGIDNKFPHVITSGKDLETAETLWDIIPNFGRGYSGWGTATGSPYSSYYGANRYSPLNNYAGYAGYGAYTPHVYNNYANRYPTYENYAIHRGHGFGTYGNY